MTSPPTPDQYSDAVLTDIFRTVRSIAIVGLSPVATRPSNYVAVYLQSKGYRILPVNPRAAGSLILGEPCIASLAELASPPDMVDIFRRSEEAGESVDDAIRAGARVVWMQLGVRDEAAKARAIAAGLSVVMDRCTKREFARLFGEIGRLGVSSGIVSARKAKMRPRAPNA